MRLLGGFLVGIGSLVLAGCFRTGGDVVPSSSQYHLLRPTTDTDTAYLEYVVIERTEGGEEINRRAWDRVDEQMFPFETRTLLESAGLRVGVTNDTAPGPLRRLIEDPRTNRGHRGRTFALDKPAELPVSGALARADFPVPGTDDAPARFARPFVQLGFDLTVREAADGRAQVKLVPWARYRDRALLLPNDPDGRRDQTTESFPGGAFDVTVSPNELLVIGTDSYWEDTFGHGAFTEALEDRRVQRLLVLRAVVVRAERPAPGKSSALPLASQAASSPRP
jgi:hypothetical protein